MKIFKFIIQSVFYGLVFGLGAAYNAYLNPPINIIEALPCPKGPTAVPPPPCCEQRNKEIQA